EPDPERVRRGRQRRRRNEVPAVERAELGEAREVGDRGEIAAGVAAAQQPADVRPHETALRGRVDVPRAVGVLVVAGGGGGPAPQGGPSCAALAPRQASSSWPARLVWKARWAK